MARRSGPARWPLVVVAVIFVALGVTALLGGGDDGGDDDGAGREAGPTPLEVPIEEVDGEPEPILVERRDHEITYRVEGFTNDGGAVLDLERRSVAVPYASRIETVPFDDPDAAPTFLQVGDFGILQTGREDEEPVVLRTEPVSAVGGAVVDVDLDAAIAAGVLEWRHATRTILDRRCQVFRATAPIDVATLGVSDDPTQWADICIAEDGLVLHEEWVIASKPFRRRIAIEIDESPSFADATFVPSGEPADGAAGGALVELTADSVPADVAFWSLADDPEGFELRGRFGHTPPRGQVDVTQAEPAKVASILDVYEDGAGGFVVVANGGTTDNRPYVEVGPDDATVDLGALGTGELVLGLRQNEVRVGLDRGRFVRVFGTLRVADLQALARALLPTTTPDGEVTPK